MACDAVFPKLGSTEKGDREREFEVSEPLGLIWSVERVAIEANGLSGIRLPRVAGYLPEVRVGRDEVVPYALLVNESRRQYPHMVFSVWIDQANFPHVPEFASRGIG